MAYFWGIGCYQAVEDPKTYFTQHFINIVGAIFFLIQNLFLRGFIAKIGAYFQTHLRIDR